MKNILILGKPGSGKGTQGKLLAEELGYDLVDAGHILRTEQKKNTPLGKEIGLIIDDGNLLPDDMINEIISNHIGNKHNCGFIFDGYPRTNNQADKLAELMDVDYVFFLEVDEDILVERILKRGESSGREDDQHEDIILQRLENYHNLTKPVKDYYKDQLTVIDGNKPISEIHEDIINSLFA